MVIGKSMYNMEASRSFAAAAKSVNASVIAYGNDAGSLATANVSETAKGITTTFYESKTRNSDDGSKADSFKASLETFTRREKLKANVAVKKTGNEDNKVSAKKIREQTLLYLILRLRRLLTGEKDLHEGVSDLYSIAKSSGGDSGSFYSSLQNAEEKNDAASGIIATDYISSSYEENETTSFETTGKVVTKDGRELDFNVAVTMSRSFSKAVSEVRQIAMERTGSFVDPLVINLDSNPLKVSDQKFYFDLDCDGKEENIIMPTASSGFIALDKNGDGVINDGSELFGTKSGNGFKDLSLYDEDGNGWIDEADEIFSKLLIWTKDEDGNDKLYKLKDLNVGAICLESVNTNFELRDENEMTEGMIRHTGFFLYEDGNAGTVQHLDIAT